MSSTLATFIFCELILLLLVVFLTYVNIRIQRRVFNDVIRLRSFILTYNNQKNEEK